MNVIVCWEKALWQSDAEIQKNLKVLNHTAMSFDIKVQIIDLNNILHTLGIVCPFDIFADLKYAKFNKYIYFLEPLGATSHESIALHELEYHDDATFVIGSNFKTLNIDDFPGAKYIHIPTPDAHPLWQDVALGILLYDMEFKKWQSPQI